VGGEAHIYWLAVGSPLSLLTFFAAAKKVGAAPHRGEANRPLRIQGKANAVGNTTGAKLIDQQQIKERPTPQANSTGAKPNRPKTNQGKANAVGKHHRGEANGSLRIQGKANGSS
jgi:hypothetical protein